MSGPEFAQHLANNQGHGPNDPNNGDEYDEYGPALPPHLAAKKKSQRAQRAQQPTRRSPSPITLPKMAPLKPSAPIVQEDSGSDDDFGPPPPTAGPSTTADEDAVREFKEREQRRKELAEVSYIPPPAIFLFLPQDCSRFSHFLSINHSP
jgi:hypothetical protein